MPNFNAGLATLKDKMQDYAYAQKVYAAMCNVTWVHESRPFNYQVKMDEYRVNPTIQYGFEWMWESSWRVAGSIVSDIREQGEDYIAFYCSGIGDVAEGTVDSEVKEDLGQLGWSPDFSYHTFQKLNDKPL